MVEGSLGNAPARGESSHRKRRPGIAFVLCVLGWLFTMFVALSFVQYRNDPFLSVFALGASLIMMIGTLLLTLRPQSRVLWGSILIATSLVYWVELFAEFGDAGLAWGLAGPFYTLVGGTLILISNPTPRSSSV